MLTAEQEAAFQGYIRGGGGFVGIHDAARLETGSSWFTQLIGSRPNAGSPTATQQAVVEIQDKAHPAGKGMPTEWTRHRRVVQLGAEPGGQRPRGRQPARALLREQGHGRQRLGAPDLLVP